jgi:hypothetical protein
VSRSRSVLDHYTCKFLLPLLLSFGAAAIWTPNQYLTVKHNTLTLPTIHTHLQCSDSTHSNSGLSETNLVFIELQELLNHFGLFLIFTYVSNLSCNAVTPGFIPAPTSISKSLSTILVNQKALSPSRVPAIGNNYVPVLAQQVSLHQRNVSYVTLLEVNCVFDTTVSKVCTTVHYWLRTGYHTKGHDLKSEFHYIKNSQ